MLKSNPVPLPRREINIGKIADTTGAKVPAPRTVESNAHVAAAAYLMKHADVTALAVVDGGEPERTVGVITAADVAQLIADGKNADEVRIYQLPGVWGIDDHLAVLPRSSAAGQSTR
jgi:predicted transcriptional regulator